MTLHIQQTWFPSNVNVTELRHKDGNKGPGEMRTSLLWESQLQQLASELLHGAHILYSKIVSPLGPSDVITARSWLAKPESFVRKDTVSLTCNEVDNRILFQHHTPSTQQYELQPGHRMRRCVNLHASLHRKGIDPYTVMKVISIKLYTGHILILLYLHYIYKKVKRLSFGVAKKVSLGG